MNTDQTVFFFLGGGRRGLFSTSILLKGKKNSTVVHLDTCVFADGQQRETFALNLISDLAKMEKKTRDCTVGLVHQVQLRSHLRGVLWNRGSEGGQVLDILVVEPLHLKVQIHVVSALA